MCPKTTPKSLPDSIGLVIRPEQFLNCKKQECHCVPGNNDPATFTSHQICLSLFECGIDLIPSCASRGNLKKAGSQGGVPVGCGTGYKIICFFFGVSSDKSLVCICTQLESRMICIRWHRHKNGHMDCFEGSESCFVSANWSS